MLIEDALKNSLNCGKAENKLLIAPPPGSKNC